MPDQFTIQKKNENIRFDKWLRSEIINIPNSLIQKLLRTNKIKVNNKKMLGIILSAFPQNSQPNQSHPRVVNDRSKFWIFFRFSFSAFFQPPSVVLT